MMTGDSIRSAARASIVAAGARLGARGLVVAAEGNLSIRLGSTILITPSGRRKDELGPDDMVEVALEPAAPSGAGRTRTRGGPGRARTSRSIGPSIAPGRTSRRSPTPTSPRRSRSRSSASCRTRRTCRRRPCSSPRCRSCPSRTVGSAALAAAVAAAFTDRGTTGERATGRARSCSSATARSRSGPDLVTAGDRLELVDLLCRVHRDVVLLRGAPSERPGG